MRNIFSSNYSHIFNNKTCFFIYSLEFCHVNMAPLRNQHAINKVISDIRTLQNVKKLNTKI